MKLKLLKLSLIYLMIFAFISSGCDDNYDDSEYTEIEVFKFSYFGCDSTVRWSLNPNYRDELNIITSQIEFDKIVAQECSPQIDFSKYVVLAGIQAFSTYAFFHDEKVKENNSTIVYTVSFSVTDATSPSAVSYYVIIEKPGGRKKFKFEEIIK